MLPRDFNLLDGEFGIRVLFPPLLPLLFHFPPVSRTGRTTVSKDTSVPTTSGVGRVFRFLFRSIRNERTREERASGRRSRCRVARRRYTQPLRASARTWLDLRQAQGQYLSLSKAASSPGSMLVRSRFTGVPPPPRDGVCFDRDAKKVRVNVSDNCFAVERSFCRFLIVPRRSSGEPIMKRR